MDQSPPQHPLNQSAIAKLSKRAQNLLEVRKAFSYSSSILEDFGNVGHAAFNKVCDSSQKALLVYVDALLSFEDFQRGTDIGS